MFDYIYGVLHCPAYRETYYEGCRLSQIYPELNLGRGSHRHVLEEASAA